MAIGYASGSTNANNYSVGIGWFAGSQNQQVGATGIGQYAGYYFQSLRATAVGAYAGQAYQGSYAAAIGFQAGGNTQSANAVAVGTNAGYNTQGNNAIAIGANAGYTNQGNNSIILNATGANLDQTTANTFTVAPVRNDTGNTANVMYYNSSTKEVTYAPPVSTSFAPIVFNNVSTQTNGKTTVFTLKTNQTSITGITNSKQLQVTLNGAILNPYIKTWVWPFWSVYGSYNGFKVVNRGYGLTANSVVIFNSPAIGSQLTITQLNNSTDTQLQRYPFSATTIATSDD